MYVRKKKLHPFMPTSVGQGFASAEDLFAPKAGPVQAPPELDEQAFKDSIRDAETGEAIGISKAGWNVVEGRLNLNTKTILAMGTGRLDIKTRIEEREMQANNVSRQSSYRSALQTPVETARTARTDRTADSEASDILFFNSFKFKDFKQTSRQILLQQHAVLPSIMDLQRPVPGFSPPGTASPSGTAMSSARYSEASFRENALVRDISSPLSVGSAKSQTSPSASPPRRHPLLTRFMKEGPLSPMHHIHWDARSNSVLTVDEDGEPLDHAEDGVDFSDDEGSAGSNSKTKGKGRMRSDSIVSAMNSVNSSSVGSTLGSKGSRNRRIKGTKGTHKGSGNNSVASSHASTVSTTHKGDNTIGQVDPSIVVTNKKHWQAVEERLFQELYTLGWQYEHNKSLTAEQGMQGGLAAVRQTARRIARMKAKSMRELVQACADEKLRETKRVALENENLNKHGYLLELIKVHDEERKKSRRYLHALEQDAEIVLIRNLNEIGWLW